MTFGQNRLWNYVTKMQDDQLHCVRVSLGCLVSLPLQDPAVLSGGLWSRMKSEVGSGKGHDADDVLLEIPVLQLWRKSFSLRAPQCRSDDVPQAGVAFNTSNVLDVWPLELCIWGSFILVVPLLHLSFYYSSMVKSGWNSWWRGSFFWVIRKFQGVTKGSTYLNAVLISLKIWELILPLLKGHGWWRGQLKSYSEMALSQRENCLSRLQLLVKVETAYI